jgi:hypothetical protein
VYFTLNSELINDRLDDTAVMTVSILGGLLIVLGIGGNFALGFVYRNGSAEHTKASNTAELRAMKTTARHAADKETTQAALIETLDRIRRSLPQHAQRQGGADAAAFLAERFRAAGQARPSAEEAIDNVDTALILEALERYTENRENGQRPTIRP